MGALYKYYERYELIDKILCNSIRNGYKCEKTVNLFTISKAS